MAETLVQTRNKTLVLRETDEPRWTVADVMAFLRMSRASVYRLRLRWSKPPGARGRLYDPAEVRLLYAEYMNRQPLDKAS